MADDIPHDGAPPEMEFDFKAEPEPLPLGVRPFDPARYHPRIHILLVRSIRHFTDFSTDAPADLLLREPDFHLSVVAVEGQVWGVTARDWYDELLAGVRDIVDKAGFSLFCSGLTRVIASCPLLGALVERCWDTTNSLHLSTTGEMTMPPYDFIMITGLGVGGDPVPLDFDTGKWEAAWIELLGAYPPLFRTTMVRYSWFELQFRGTKSETEEEIEQYAWGFLMFLISTTLFTNRANTVRLYLLSALVVLPRVSFYD
ncbi:hypothetical protein CsSME_00018883 [Camellia sinensis var. sinensis]